ncbi:hypothetical protein VAR608DRAFT_0269 [Variovorax sp. HW608]|uniref:hypothetical protein n=1 Tax=Variovorax sp. HW608 TaxID=1034889 RepID=UPI00081F9F69|nr:hypothetical protein [Variovorax sp. HW608]SCK08690.1 hypothetical protein VAR608DRAFT_0269 [Variovorax sp. HW608]
MIGLEGISAQRAPVSTKSPMAAADIVSNVGDVNSLAVETQQLLESRFYREVLEPFGLTNVEMTRTPHCLVLSSMGRRSTCRSLGLSRSSADALATFGLS